MFDANLLFTNGTAVDTNGDSTALHVYKTAAEGVPIEIAVTAVTGTSPTLDVKVQESDNDSDYNDVAVFPQITATGAYCRQVQSKKAYLRLDYTVGGTTPSFTVKAGIVSGKPFYATA
jgi:hypothetical protein